MCQRLGEPLDLPDGYNATENIHKSLLHAWGGVLQVMVTHSDQALANAVWCVTSGEDPGRSERLVLETLASIPDPSQT
jgi:hypothetical protein